MELATALDLLRNTDPAQTSLLMGAGAAFSSGAPLAVDLCRHLETTLGDGARLSEDLAEVAGILENRTSRKQLAQAIVDRLQSLQPDGGLVALSSFGWRSIFSTNYDLLVERAYESTKLPLEVVRSHFDWESAHSPGVTKLYKIHGCVTQDRGFGHRSSMIITEDDYVEFDRYRNLLFERLGAELAGSNCWIIGHSLRDPHLKQLIDRALRLQRDAAAPGRLHVLVHQYDEDRAELLRRRGIRAVVQGDINAFTHCLQDARAKAATPAESKGGPTDLPMRLRACTIDTSSTSQPPNPKRLFFGGAATHADIAAGYTFERSAENTTSFSANIATVITGVAGTGKTTLARRFLGQLSGDGWLTFEHRQELPLQPDLWIEYERALASAGRQAVLLIDNCPPFQRQVNILIRGLPDDSSLHLLLTAETSTWVPRQKDPRLFSHADAIELSELNRLELRRLLSLVRSVGELRGLIAPEFLQESNTVQEDTLRRRCRADMFVCLKALFSSESIDNVILREFAQIDPVFQEVYRTTAALEAAGALPHRQMVLRLTRMPTSLIGGALDVLEGLVSESDISSSSGVYIWRTRHEVIARILSRYKYSDQSQLRALLEATIDSVNPSYFEEVRTLREMCNSEYGIRALTDPSDRIHLYGRIVVALPNDRVARHRIVRELIDNDRLGDAEAELHRAIEDVGLDPPLQRYRVRLGLARSRAAGILPEDRRAILVQALNEAERGVEQFPESKYMYFAAADAAEAWFDLTGERGRLAWAEQLLRDAHEKLLDPDINSRSIRLARR